MNHQESESPPILQGDFVVPPPVSSWPKVLGVISIVLGALGGLMNLWGTVAPLFLDAFGSMMPKDPASQASLQAQKDLAPYTMLSGGFNFIGSLMLLVAGIGLCLRARWGVKATKIWIPWRMATAILAAIVGYLGMQASLKAMGQQPNAPPGMAAMGGAFGIAVIVFTVVWGWAYPVFLLIWFRRPKIRAEVETWA
jgi:hypothetical protein